MAAKSGTSAQELNDQATYPGTRYGKNGMAPGVDDDHSDETIISRGTPGGNGNGS